MVETGRSLADRFVLAELGTAARKKPGKATLRGPRDARTDDLARRKTMRRINGVIALALLLVLGNLTLACATADSSRDHPQTMTLQLTDTEVDSASLDLGAPGEGYGDQLLGTGNLTRHGKPAGEAHLSCTLTRRAGTASTFQCSGVLALPAGQIAAQGAALLVDDQPIGFSLAVTGGTGAYRTAHGQLKTVELSSTERRITVELVL